MSSRPNVTNMAHVPSGFELHWRMVIDDVVGVCFVASYNVLNRIDSRGCDAIPRDGFQSG